MRLDKFLSDMGVLSRSESKRMARSGAITVNGIAARDTSVHIDPEKDIVVCGGETITYSRFVYIMLNKPSGVLSATEDGDGTTVLDLLPEKYGKMGLFPCGRLDKYTLGLLILTNDGQTAHSLLSPAHHVDKTYLYECEKPLTADDAAALERGVDIGEKSSTRPANVEMITPTRGHITVVEGKYHQIKRMFKSIGNAVTYLERISFGSIPLDASLKRGEWRLLTEDEIAALKSRIK